jgi:multidrug resistance efflux pump
MTWLRRARPALFVVGFALAVGCLLGARALTAGHGSEGQKTASPVGGSGKATGPVVLGTVDSDPPPIDYRLPAVLQSGTVVRVAVKDGQEVKAGDELYAFDDSIQKGNLERAKAAVKIAQAKVDEAREKASQHVSQIKLKELDVDAAKLEEQLKGNYFNLVKSTAEKAWRTESQNKITQAELEAKFKDYPEGYKANVDYAVAKQKRELKEAELAELKAVNPDLIVKEAEAGVQAAKAEEANAQTAVDLCVIKAKTAGTVEQIAISPGSTLGIGTRTPAMWLIPGGSRVVWAEIEAEFAHRVGKDLEGKEVTIMDNTDPKLTYKGTVTRVGTSFLPKRFGTEGLLNNDTRVLPVRVEVPEPPAGDPRPPLRVGQRVRVNLGQ